MAENPESTLEGGCLCGQIRYRITARPLAVGYCHCRMCQRASGAPVAAWAAVPVDAFQYTIGEPSVFASSAWGERRFCATCGSRLEYREREAPTEISVDIGSLDDPNALRPETHIYCASQLAWFDTLDDLPRHQGEGPVGQDDPT